MPSAEPLQTHYMVLEYPDGWGGENSDWPPDALLHGQLSATWNVYHIGPELLRRPGDAFQFFVSAGASIVAGFESKYLGGAKWIVQSDNGRFWQASAGMTSAAAMGTSAFGSPATFAFLPNAATSGITAIATNGGQVLGTSGDDSVWALGDATTPKARFIIAYKNRLYADDGSVSGGVFWSAIGGTTGLPTVNDWTTSNNAGNRIFGYPLVGLAAGRDQWYAFGETNSSMVTGATPISYVTVDIDREAGLHHRSIANVGRGLVGCNKEGIHEILDGSLQPLAVNRIRTFWRNTVDTTAVSGFWGAWSAQRDQYRLSLLTSAGAYMMLYGVLEANKEFAWYRESQPARSVFSFLNNARRDFLRGGNADGNVYLQDALTTFGDASGSMVASAETAIIGHYLPGHSSLRYIPYQGFMDKTFKKAWVWARTRGTSFVSSDFFIHAESGKFAPSAGRWTGLATSAGDVKRFTHHLDDYEGWGVSWRVTFDTLSVGSVHRAVVQYEEARVGEGVPY